MGDYENRIGEVEHMMVGEAYSKMVKPFLDAISKDGEVNVSNPTSAAPPQQLKLS